MPVIGVIGAAARKGRALPIFLHPLVGTHLGVHVDEQQTFRCVT
jgi:hypothetical protein